MLPLRNRIKIAIVRQAGNVVLEFRKIRKFRKKRMFYEEAKILCLDNAVIELSHLSE